MQSEENGKSWIKVVLFPLYVYRKLVSPLVKPRCIYYPTCSEYFERAVVRHGLFRGSLKGTYRVLRCHPFTKGGYDPP